ncbi:hypothetical protein AKJ49_00090 [candidate division MSBL1 archaeon SCGC-AAA382A03]|uniref:Rubrerythrin diiron-binding domain-containing protein n=1 Tax=candidate division MSBL1 archaeon SCGC-AAA382A03 TaxID=1698278 RepID=A0A133VH64_9EURY|nr:hypothetical protein AKJ49_00090 [candidate division MSBL1 archaeon SCGC-AAA382A03]
MSTDKNNFEKILAKLAFLESKLEKGFSSDFFSRLSEYDDVNDVFSYLMRGSQKHFEMLNNSVDGLERAVKKHKKDFNKLRELYSDLEEASIDIIPFLQEQYGIEKFASSQYESLVETLEDYEEEKIEDGVVKFGKSKIQNIAKEIREEEEKHAESVRKLLDKIEREKTRRREERILELLYSLLAHDLKTKLKSTCLAFFVISFRYYLY